MIESGFDEGGVAADPEKACALYLKAHKMGNLDATINLAFYYLNVSTISSLFSLCTICFRDRTLKTLKLLAKLF